MKVKCLDCGATLNIQPDKDVRDPQEDLEEIIPQHNPDCITRLAWEARSP